LTLFVIGVCPEIARRILLSKLKKKFPKEKVEEIIENDNSLGNSEKINLIKAKDLNNCVKLFEILFKVSLYIIFFHLFRSLIYSLLFVNSLF
jgi:hypothetical protein